MNTLDKLAHTILESQKDKSPKPYDTEAVVTRIEGGTAYVHIPGGVNETPAKMVVSASKGDAVRVRVSGGKAYVTGNASAPPTDDTKANIAEASAVTAHAAAKDAMSKAAVANKNADIAYTIANNAADSAESAQDTAYDAYRIADSTNQYFWMREEGTDTGAHITEVPQREWDDPESANYHSGGNLLARSNGIAVRDGLDELAVFGADGAQLGKNGESRLLLDYHSLKMIDKEGNVYFHISDLRDTTGTAQIAETFTGTGSKEAFSLSAKAVNTSYSVEAYVDLWDYVGDVLEGPDFISFENAPPQYSTITINYRTSSDEIIERSFQGDGTTKIFHFTPTAYTVDNANVYIDYANYVTKYDSYIAFDVIPAEGTKITVTYDSSSEILKAYTIGCRKSGSDVGLYSVALGKDASASGPYSVSLGGRASGEGSYAEIYALASGFASHAEGSSDTEASGDYAHAEGNGAVASGNYSHAQNSDTIAAGGSQTAIGRLNVEDTDHTYAFIIGNGKYYPTRTRSNAFTVDWNGNVDIASGAQYKIDGVNLASIFYPVGSMYVTSTNTNPSAWLGGTWTLTKKSFAYKWATGIATFNTTNTTDGVSVAVIHGNTIEFRLIWKNKVAISDTTQTIATITGTDIGVSGTNFHNAYANVNADGLNAIGIARISANNNVLTILTDDWVSRAATLPTTTGQECVMSYTYTVQDPSSMIDSFCDAFYWKRTA